MTTALVVVHTEHHPPIATLVIHGGAPHDILVPLHRIVEQLDEEELYRWAERGHLNGGYDHIEDTTPSGSRAPSPRHDGCGVDYDFMYAITRPDFAAVLS